MLKDKKGVEHAGGFEWKMAVAVRTCSVACCVRVHAYRCGTMQACTIFVQVDEAGPRFKVTLGPNGSMHPPYVGGLVYDCYNAQTLISAPRAEGDADFEMHDLKSMSAWHRPYHTPVSPYPSLAACLPDPHHHQPPTHPPTPQRPHPYPTPSRCGRHVMWEQLIHSRRGWEEALSADQVQHERDSSHARGAHVRSLGAMVLNGLSLCDHPNVGSLLWWALGYASRRAARANMPLAVWAAAHGMVPPAQWQAAAAAPGLAGMAPAAAAAAAAAAVAAAIAAAGAAGPVGAAAAGGGGNDGDGDGDG